MSNVAWVKSLLCGIFIQLESLGLCIVVDGIPDKNLFVCLF